MKLPAIALSASLLVLPTVADAGEIVKKKYFNSRGEAVTQYVYQAGSSRGSYSRSTSTARRYPAYRSSGYTYYPTRGYSTRRYQYCRPARPAVRTTRTNITYNAACPITVGGFGHRGAVRVYRRR